VIVERQFVARVDIIAVNTGFRSHGCQEVDNIYGTLLVSTKKFSANWHFRCKTVSTWLKRSFSGCSYVDKGFLDL